MSKNKALSDFVSDISNAAVGDYLFLDSAGDRTIARQVLGSDISGFTAPYDSASVVSLLDSNYVDTELGGGGATSITGADVNSKLAALDNSVVPTTSMNLGSTTKKWKNIYTNKLSFGGISIDTNGLDGGNATLSGIITPSDYVLVNNIVLSTPTFIPTVSNSAETAFLLKTDSTQSDAQGDASTNAATITQNGNVTSTAFSPYHPKGYSVYFDGTGDYLRIPFDSSFSYSSVQPFTIDMWFHPLVSGTDAQYIASSNTGSADANLNWLFRQKSNNTLRFVMIDQSGTVVECDSSDVMNINEWNHVSVVMTGSSIKHWLNGIFQQEVSFTGSMKVNGNIDIAAWGTTSYFNGYITDFRYNVGEQIYTGTADIDVPTERLTANSYTKALACHLSYIADGSSSDHSITVNGNTKTQQLGPYDHETYSPSDYGGSVYFDGAGDYLSCGSGSQFDMGTGDFTWEAWVYPMQASRSQQIISVGDSNATIYALYFRSTNKFAFYGNSTLYLESSSTFSINQWYYVAVVREGNDFTLYVNGTSVDTYSTTAAIGSSTEGAYVGTNKGLSTQDWKGYISDARVVKGTAVYTSGFTPPTAPLTAITNTQLLTCANKNNVWNAGSVGNGLSNLLQGNATLSTSITKNESASVQLDGTGDYIKIDDTNPIFDVSTGDFTWEGWFRFNAITNNPKIFVNLASATVYWQLYVYNNALRLLGNTGNTLSGTASGTLSTSTWYHIAFVRVGNVFNVYLDGSSVITDSYSSSIGHNSDYGVGGTSTYPNNNINGNVEGVRLSKYARYTSAFTPPTAELEG